MIVFRHVDPRLPFLQEDDGQLQEDDGQPAARWHGHGEGPVQYFADTPDGAWAEFLRHEDIRDPADLATVRRTIWAVELPDEPASRADLPNETLTGGPATHAACLHEARRLRASGVERLDVPSAALVPGGARGHRVRAGLDPGPAREGRTIVLFGRRPDLVGWRAAGPGGPDAELLGRVRYFD